VYIRKTKSRDSTCFQIGHKVKGKFVLIKHVGCAMPADQIEVLRLKAEDELLLYENQLSLFPSRLPMTTAKLTNWHITGFHSVFGCVYDNIGFPNNMLRDLVVARIAHPGSKLATTRYLDQYLGIGYEKDTLYRFLDTLNKDELTRIAYDFVSKKDNGIALIFYDVTTLYFEASETTNDEDIRNKGFSKDHKNELLQIVVGLFVDRNGYPIDFDFYSGETFEGHTFPKAIKAITTKYQFTDLVIVADAGMLSETNINFLETEKISYIVGARLKGMSEKAKEPIFTHNFTQRPFYDETYTTKLVTGETITKRLIVDYSDKRAKKDEYSRNKIVESLKKKIKARQSLIKKSKYLVVENQGEATGIDQAKVELDKRHDGLKGYWTNLKDKTKPNEVIDQYHNLWQVEKAFRMSKGDLAERPIFHRIEKRIQAHLVLCFCSLLVMKETERIIKPTNISLTRTIELLGKVGQGETRIGNVTFLIESELSTEASTIIQRIKKHQNSDRS
jgi:transposase